MLKKCVKCLSKLFLKTAALQFQQFLKVYTQSLTFIENSSMIVQCGNVKNLLLNTSCLSIYIEEKL